MQLLSRGQAGRLLGNFPRLSNATFTDVSIHRAIELLGEVYTSTYAPLPTVADELSEYLQQPTVPVDDVFLYWEKVRRSGKWVHLAAMALDILSSPGKHSH